MRHLECVLAAVAGSALAVGAVASAVPIPRPTYVFCEEERNDTCPEAQMLDASLAAEAAGGINTPSGESVRDCFYITGKLQEDCVWDIEPKCALKAYGKHLPCRDTYGRVIPGQFYEPIIGVSDGGDLFVTPLVDGTIRLGIASLFDAADGTINGLAGNAEHREVGEVTVKIFHRDPDDGESPDQAYVFRLVAGAEAVRVSFVVPPDVTTALIQCCVDTGTAPLCYDVDFYLIENLIPGRFYAVEQVGGLTGVSDIDNQEDCVLTNVKIGVFDKQCFLLHTSSEPGWSARAVVHPKVYSAADENGRLRIGVTGGASAPHAQGAAEGGGGTSEDVPADITRIARDASTADCDFDGLRDDRQWDYYDLLADINFFNGSNFAYTPGASTKDESIQDVIRYPRPVWDPFNPFTNPEGFDLFNQFSGPPERWAAHGVCGGYCLKVTLAEHLTPSGRPRFPAIYGASRADVNGDGVVNATDLALMLSYWGVVQ